MSPTILSCKICGGISELLDVVDFNKSCEERNGKFLEISGIPIYYARCSICGFCWSPEMHGWTMADFENRVYNNNYKTVDPEYQEKRPRAFAHQLLKIFPRLPKTVRHLDYGGGNGLLSQLLCERNWNSSSYDPFVNKETEASSLGAFSLITAFEVFEHVPSVSGLMRTLKSLLTPDGIVMFSTALSDGHIRRNMRLSWWYASPRNGHISLFSRESLLRTGQTHGFIYGSVSNGFHVFSRVTPEWAVHLESPARIPVRVIPQLSLLLGPAIQHFPRA